MPQALCLVPGCRNTGDHILPANRQRRFLWIDAIRGDNPDLQDWTPKPTVKYSYVCGSHFKEEDYIVETCQGKESKRRTLKRTAVPSIFPWTSTTTQDVAKDFGLTKAASPVPRASEPPWQSTSRMPTAEDSKRQLIYSSIISQHADHLLTKLYVQFIKRRNCDLTIKLSDMWLYAHTCVVDAFTDTGNHAQLRFENMDGKSVLDLGPFQCDVILPLVEMMYTGELAVIPSLVEEVAQAAKFIGFQEAYKGCEVYMKLHKSSQDDLEQRTPQTETDLINEIVHSVPVTTSFKTGKTKTSSTSSTPEPVKFPALKVKGQEPVKKKTLKGMVYVKGKSSSQSAEKDHSNLKKEGKGKGQTDSQEQDLENFELPIQIKQEPVDGFELQAGPGHENSIDEVQKDTFDASVLYRSLGKREEKQYTSEMLGTSDEYEPEFLDQSKSYAGNWAKNTMNLNTAFASQDKISKNVYTLLPYKPTDSEIYASKKRGRPKDIRYMPTTMDYLTDNAHVGIEVDDIPIQFDYDADNFNYLDEAEIDKISKEVAAELAAQISEKRKGKHELKVRLRAKLDGKATSEEKTKKKRGANPSPKKEDGTEVSGYGNTFIEVKSEPVDSGYEKNDAEVQAEEEKPESDSDNESTGQRRSKRRRISKQTFHTEYDYDYDTDEIGGGKQKSSKEFQTHSDNNELSEDDQKVKSPASKQTVQRNSDAIINPSLLKGSSFVGTICQTSSTNESKSKKTVKTYLDSIGLHDSGSDSDSEAEPVEVDAGVKIIEPTAIVPKGTRSRYTQPTLAEVKDKFVRTHTGHLKKVATVIKTKPKIFQGHQKKPNPGPVYVMCHPTKPIVKL